MVLLFRVEGLLVCLLMAGLLNLSWGFSIQRTVTPRPWSATRPSFHILYATEEDSDQDEERKPEPQKRKSERKKSSKKKKGRASTKMSVNQPTVDAAAENEDTDKEGTVGKSEDSSETIPAATPPTSEEAATQKKDETIVEEVASTVAEEQQEITATATDEDSEKEDTTEKAEETPSTSKEDGTAEKEEAASATQQAVDPSTTTSDDAKKEDKHSKRKVVIIGAGWGGLSTAHALSKDPSVDVTLVEASPRVGGLVRDGFTTTSGQRPAEAGQHGFWNNYHNIYRLLQEEIPGLSLETALTDYAEQGQYSPQGLEAVWPVYRDQPFELPTGLAQAAFTRFLKLPLLDRITAFPLVLAFSEFDDSVEAWERYDAISFRDLCTRLCVSKRCYDEAFEPMILTGLFAPGAECSAAAALGMAYFFVLQSQKAFDVQWCRGNIGEVIFDPWVKTIGDAGVRFQTSTSVTGFEVDKEAKRITHVKAKTTNGNASTEDVLLEADEVVFAVGARALSTFVQYCPELAQFPDLAKFANLRGTSVLATRIFLDQEVDIPYTANACWGFDKGVGMTVFDIKGLHGNDAWTVADAPGSVIEVDYYHASKLLVLSDDDIVAKVKRDLDSILVGSRSANVVDAAIVRLPQGVNWYYPGSYQDMPDASSESLHNLYFAGDIVRSRHGSWSQEKAFVSGVEAANAILGKPPSENILPVAADELHVQFGKRVVNLAKKVLGRGDPWKGPSLVDFFW